MDMRDYPTLHLDTNQSRNRYTNGHETIQHYTWIQISQGTDIQMYLGIIVFYFGFQFTWTKGVNYCHHLASVVCKLFTFQDSFPKPLGQLEPNLAGMFLGWSSTKFLFFVPVGYSTWLPGSIICSHWLKLQRSSSLKLMN